MLIHVFVERHELGKLEKLFHRLPSVTNAAGYSRIIGVCQNRKVSTHVVELVTTSNPYHCMPTKRICLFGKVVIQLVDSGAVRTKVRRAAKVGVLSMSFGQSTYSLWWSTILRKRSCVHSVTLSTLEL